MPLPDVCLGLDVPGAGGPGGGAGPGAPSGNDGGTEVGPGGGAGSETNTGPAQGPLSNYNPGYGSVTTGWPYIMLIQEMRKDIYLQLKDDVCGEGTSDLSDIDHIQLVAKEWMSSPEIYLTKDCSIVDAADGLIKIRFKPKNIPYAGIWPSAVVCYNSDNEVIAQYRCYLYIQPNINKVGSSKLHNYPIQLHEIRLQMRDTCPEANTLLEDVEFSDLEILYAIQRPIEEWNETTPDLGDSGFSFTQNTFPWREHWRRAVCGYLLQTAAIWQQRNNLSYNAGGVSVDDYNKATPYLGIATRLLEEWREWMLLKKREINIQLCYGSINSISFGYPFNYTDRTW
jgi:hypothetical protein